MARLALTLACENADRVRPILDGRVQPEGIDLNFLPMGPEEAFWRMTQFLEFEVSEMSGTAYIIERSRPNPRFLALPVFLSRMFRHNGMYTHAASDLTDPSQLRGRKVGLPEYNLTACVWMRGILQHEYGIHPREIQWFVGGQEQPGRRERADVPPPPDVPVEPLAPDQTLNTMLERGALDAVLAPRLPRPMSEGATTIRRILADPWTAEEDYYRRTRIFPIMHIIVIRQDVYEAHPWIAMSLYKAFGEAKALTQRDLYQAHALQVTLPWALRELERDRAVFGSTDLWPYGLEASRPTLEAMVQYHHEQGLIPERMPLESLFAPSTLDEYRI